MTNSLTRKEKSVSVAPGGCGGGVRTPDRFGLTARTAYRKPRRPRVHGTAKIAPGGGAPPILSQGEVNHAK